MSLDPGEALLRQGLEEAHLRLATDALAAADTWKALGEGPSAVTTEEPLTTKLEEQLPVPEEPPEDPAWLRRTLMDAVRDDATARTTVVLRRQNLDDDGLVALVVDLDDLIARS